MAVDSNGLSDTELVVDSSGLSDVCSKWSSDIASADLGSIDVSGSFSALTQNGIGVGYIESLQNALKSSDRLALSISKLISSAAEDQTNADKSGTNKSNTSGSVRTTGGGTSGSRGTRGSNSGTTVTTASTQANNSTADTNINTGADNKKVELEQKDQITLVTNLQSIIDGSIYDYLFDTNYASKIKETLLSSPKLSDDLKQKISQMDQNELQVQLKNIYVSGESVSDFSKIIVTIFDSDLKNSSYNSKISDSAKNIADVYTFIAKQSNYQEQLKEVYFGTSQISKVDDNVVLFTRSFVDTLATASNVSYENILNDSKYQESLLIEIEDLSNTFAVIDAAKTEGSSTYDKLYSNLIIKE